MAGFKAVHFDTRTAAATPKSTALETIVNEVLEVIIAGHISTLRAWTVPTADKHRPDIVAMLSIDQDPTGTHLTTIQMHLSPGSDPNDIFVDDVMYEIGLDRDEISGLAHIPPQIPVHLIELIVNRLVDFAATIDTDRPGRARRLSIPADDVARTVAAFEVPARHLEIAIADGLFTPDDEEFVRSTLRQLDETRRRGSDANPKLIELLVADLVRKLLSHLTSVETLEREFIRLGADPGTAAVTADRTAEAIRRMTTLGGDDPEADAAALDAIADTGDELAGLAGEIVRGATEGVASESGRAAAEGAGRFAAFAFKQTWPFIQLGLIMFWHSVRDIFLD